MKTVANYMVEELAKFSDDAFYSVRIDTEGIFMQGKYEGNTILQARDRFGYSVNGLNPVCFFELERIIEGTDINIVITLT